MTAELVDITDLNMTEQEVDQGFQQLFILSSQLRELAKSAARYLNKITENDYTNCILTDLTQFWGSCTGELEKLGGVDNPTRQVVAHFKFTVHCLDKKYKEMFNNFLSKTDWGTDAVAAKRRRLNEAATTRG